MNDLAAICDACLRPIRDGEGYLGVCHGEITAYWAAEAAWKQAHPGTMHSIGELMSLPDHVQWRTAHYACLSADDFYDIEVQRIRSWPALVRVTAHLMSKTWLRVTDWPAVLEDAADQSQRRRITSAVLLRSAS